jgi:Fe-S cluster assembly protein SufD
MTDTQNSSSIIETHLAKLNESNDSVNKHKADAITSFMKMGFPTTRHEEWKYTPTLFFSKSELDYRNSYVVKNSEVLEPSVFESINKIVFINGSISLHHSVFTDDIEVHHIDASASHTLFQAHFNTLANNTKEPYVAFNTSFYMQGVFVVVKKNSVLEQPILIEYHDTSEAVDYLQQIRNLIVFESGAHASIIVKHYTKDAVKSLSNEVNELILYPNSHAKIYLIQDNLHEIQNLNTWEIAQERDANCDVFTYSDSGALVRNNLHIAMNAPGLTCDTKAIYLASKKSIIDNHLKIEHKLPHCSSFQLYRGVMNDEGTGVFNGKIHVHVDAQKTDAYQSNKNLLLSKNANIYTKPQLEIFADDVKCSHGAAIGNIDENALFYLIARGISKATAKSMLTVAFANEVIEKLDNEAVKTYVEKAIERALDADIRY